MIKFMGFLMTGSLLVMSCDDEEPEPAIPVLTLDFEGDCWTRLIDSRQYGGPLIYSEDEYKWADATTGLCSEVKKADWTAFGGGWGWENGIAVSNYVNPDATSYLEQLSVTSGNGNFAVAYNDGSRLYFGDGKDHEFVSADLSPVAYAYHTMLQECGEGYEFKVVLTFNKADGTSVAKEVLLADGDNVQEGFKTVELGVTATSMDITFDGTNKGDWGLNTPKYVALDNVVVRK